MTRRRDQDRAATLPLALREVDGHLAYTAGAVWAWFLLPPQRWAFRSEAQRLGLLLGAGDAYAALAGHRLHLRVTTRPYPSAAWARGLDLRTPHPLPDPSGPGGASGPGESWGDYLVRAQRHLRASTMAEKQVYLGVRVASRGRRDSLVERLLRRPGGRELQRVGQLAERVAEVVASPGLDGAPATAAQMEWLLRRSVGLGLPAPGRLSTTGDPAWGTDDLHAFTDPVDYAVEPFASTVRVRGRVGGEDVAERHVSVLTLGRMEELEVPDSAHDPWLAQTDRLGFPVEWSVRADVLTGVDAQEAIQRRLLVIRDMQRHYAEHDLDEPLALERQARQAKAVEDDMTQGAEVLAHRVHGWFRVAVSAETQEECLQRVRRLTDAYRARRIAVEQPKGQYALLREFIPGEPVASTAHRRRMPALYFSAGLPTASSTLGDRRGPYVGYTAGSSRKAVMFDTHYATEVRETSGLVPIVGGLGAGKSVLMGLLTYDAARRGVRSVVLDPSGPLAKLCELPELRQHSRHIDLTSAAAGTLNPYGVVPAPRRDLFATAQAYEEAKVLAAQDRKMLALDVARMLLPPSLDALPATRIVITDAIRATAGAPMTSLWSVLELLDGHADPHGRVVANYLRDMAEMPLGRLVFPPPGVLAPEESETLTVLTMSGLVLPARSVPREHWSTSEQLAVPLLHLAAWYASRAVYGRPMHERKLMALDETHFLGDWGAGRALFTRLGRDSRKWNTCVLAASQNPRDVLGMDVANLIAAAFVGRIEDEETAADGLRMLRVPTGTGYERVLASLSPHVSGAVSAEGRSPYREFVMRDVDGHVDKMRVDLSGNPGLRAALDTTARPCARSDDGLAARMEDVA